MPETHLAPDPVPVRPRFRTPRVSLRELWRKKPRTSGSRNVLPRLLTSLQAMWLLDLRERLARAVRERSRRSTQEEFTESVRHTQDPGPVDSRKRKPT